MLRKLWKDEFGFIVSAELVLVATILVLGMIVGLSEIQHAVVQELNDVADAFGSVNQSYGYSGFSASKSGHKGRIKSFTNGSAWSDHQDDCDGNECALACDPPEDESYKY
jgi:Flp pilus assembly pilin Flp